MKYPPIARFKSAEEFAEHLARVSEAFGAPVSCDSAIETAPKSPLAQPINFGGRTVGNRFAIHPMEGWDGMRDGTPSEWTLRRWKNFGISGAKLIWGGEAVAVSHEGRANPNQLYYRPENEKGLARLLEATRAAHREKFATTDDLVVGLQITHSGRFAHPNEFDRLEPRIVHFHPVLDRRLAGDPAKALLTDGELDGIVEAFVDASIAAQKLGFDFVDIKHCHGYLLHELLAAKTRPGNYGGSFENRTRFLREVVGGLKRDAPGLAFGARVSIYDLAPRVDEVDLVDGVDGVDEGDTARPESGYDSASVTFGRMSPDLKSWESEEPFRFLQLCRDLGAISINISAATPYYSAHMQRPAAYPPVDSLELRQDPLIGVIRQLQITAESKRVVPGVPLVGSAYSYLQEYLPHVAQAQVREGHVDFVGLGRMVLANPTLPEDVLARGKLQRNRLCRTFSDCTNGPRMGFISGCFPLDAEYKALPEWKQIQARKREMES